MDIFGFLFWLVIASATFWGVLLFLALIHHILFHQEPK